MKNSYQQFNEHNPTNFVRTPLATAKQLQSLLLKHCSPKTVLDPCAGTGILTDDLSASITSYDIEPRGSDVIAADFLEPPTVHYDAAIVNPPFNLKKQFIDKCLQQADYVAVIAPYRWAMRQYNHYIIDCWHDFKTNSGFTDIATTVALFVLSSQKHEDKFVDKSLSDKYVLLTDRIYREDYDKYPDDAYAVTTNIGGLKLMRWSEVKAHNLTATLAYVTDKYWAALNVYKDCQKHWKEQYEMTASLNGKGTGWFSYGGLASYKYIPVRTMKDDFPDAEQLIISGRNKSYNANNFRKYADASKGYAVVRNRDYAALRHLPAVPYSPELLDYFNNIDYNDDDVKFVTHLGITFQLANLVFDPLQFKLHC